MTIDTTVLTQAFSYAAEAHDGQVRKGTETYLSHPMAVSGLVIEFGGDTTQAVAGLLHDVVEDQGGLERLADMQEHFGDQARDLVYALSDATPAEGEAKPPWRQRKERYLDYLAELAAVRHPAMLVACATSSTTHGASSPT